MIVNNMNMRSTIKAVLVNTKNSVEVQLYDIYIDDKWVGSRRTMEYAEQYVSYLLAE